MKPGTSRDRPAGPRSATPGAKVRPRPAPAPGPREGRRLAAFLADAGVAARRKAEQLVRSGKVTVDGRAVRDPAFKLLPGQRVEHGGLEVRIPARRVYMLLNKPPGCLSAAEDKGGKPTVLDLVPSGDRRLYPVGRLDFNAEGLVLLTDDGDLAYRLTHPRYQVPRTYLVKVKGQPGPAALRRAVRGVTDQGELLRAREARVVKLARANAWVEAVLTEGRWHEVRRLFEAVGHPVLRLIRTSFGPLELGMIPPGGHRRLSRAEALKLKAYVEELEG